MGTPLTEEELAQVNGAFDYSQPGEADQEKKLERSCFFTSSYEDVTELNLEEFLRYYSNGSSTLEDEDAEEFQALAALPDFPYDAEALETWESRCPSTASHGRRWIRPWRPMPASLRRI